MCCIRATELEIDIIRDLAKKSWYENYRGILSDDQIRYMLDLMYSEQELRSHFKNHNYLYYFIENSEQQPIGFMGFEKDFDGNTTKLHRIYLLKDEKSKGYGKKAIGFLKKWVRDEGNLRIILTVNKNNPAIQFYQAQGFKIYDEKVFNIGHGYVMDDYLMEVQL